MSDQGQTLALSYLTAAGQRATAYATVMAEASSAPSPLLARLLKFDDGREVYQVTVGRLSSRSDQEHYYRLIDSENLVGLRLARQAGHGEYPPQLARMIGYDADSAAPFALFEPYRGEAVETVAGHLLPAGQHRFQVSLLTGLRWLAEAGIAHRGLSPATVRWDGDQVQITDFSLATVIGAAREAVGSLPWAAPEQRAGQATDKVTVKDDIWAAGRLIYYVTTGDELRDREQLRDWPALMDLLTDVFGPPDLRPTARDLLVARLREADPVPRGIGADPALKQGYVDFYAARERRHELAADQAGSSADHASEQKRTRRSWLRVLPFLISLTVLALIAVVGVEVWPR
jgi:hypothetical protein